MKRMVWWLVILFVFIPGLLWALAAYLFVYFDEGIEVIHDWAYQEPYVPKARKPGDL